MSQEEEVKQIVGSIAGEAETKSYELIQHAEGIGRFIASFSAITNGTNDLAAKKVCAAFTAAQKELLKAAKASIIAANAGHDWCGGTPKTHVKKKVR